MAVRIRRVSRLPELISFAINNENHGHRHERGRDDQYQNSTAQSLNHSSAGRGGLRIAERTILGEGRRGGEHNQRGQTSEQKRFVFSDAHHSFRLSSFPLLRNLYVIWRRAPRRPASGSCRSTHIASPAGQKW